MSDDATPALDVHKVAAARLWAASRYPYLASALFASPAVAVADLGGAAVDEFWRVYLDPVAVDRWTVPELGGELVHHAGHLVRDHADRGRALGLRADERSHWVDAADAEINDDLPDDVSLPDEQVMPADLGCDEGRFAEEYFREGEVRDDDGHDCGSGAHGDPEAWDQGEPESSGDGVDHAQGDVLRRRVAADVVAHGREHGDVPAGLARWAEQLVGGRVDWRTELAAELRRGVSEAMGAVDYSYSRPSRRAAVTDVVLPTLRKPTPEVAVVCDTSGSITDDLLAEAIAEVDGVLAAVGARGVRLLACDTSVHSVERVRATSQLATVGLAGGGGTDMGAGIAAAVDHRPHPQVVVVLTDAYSPWPAEPPPRVRVVVGLLGATTGRAPEWARTVRIGDAG